jgi:hypothetical protein
MTIPENELLIRTYSQMISADQLPTISLGSIWGTQSDTIDGYSQ